MKYSVVIATYNRADDLRETLASLSALRADGDWEVIVVDNNSTDGTHGVVEDATRAFPAPLRYATESEQGRSPALNSGIRLARGDIIVTTDDDVRVEADWLNHAGAGLDAHGCDFVGGRVLPIWRGTRPAWLPNHGGQQWAVIALLDYGSEAMPFGSRVPLGVNMAFRRQAFARAGLLDPRTGRKAGTLLGQEVREWCIRARAANVRGMYIPDMVVRHVIPASRLNKKYFRRWFYWRGVSRAMLYAQYGLDMEKPEDRALDARTVPQPFGVPRYLFRKAVAHLVAAVRMMIRRDVVAAFEHELWLCFFAGIVRQRWADRHTTPADLRPGNVPFTA